MGFTNAAIDVGGGSLSKPSIELACVRTGLIVFDRASTAAALAAVTCGNGGWVIWGIRGSRLAIKCV
jgi:hypothetical protein